MGGYTQFRKLVPIGLGLEMDEASIGTLSDLGQIWGEHKMQGQVHTAPTCGTIEVWEYGINKRLSLVRVLAA